MASCAQIELLLQGYIDGELDKRERAALEHHLNHCASCSQVLAQQEHCVQTVRSVLHASRLQGDLTPAVLAHLPEMDSHIRRRRRTWIRQTEHWLLPILRTAAPAVAVSVLVIVAIGLLISWPPSSGSSGEVIGMITQQLGRAQQSHVTSTETRSTELAGRVHGNERFETFDGGQLMISLAGDTRVKLDANTRVVVQNTRKVAVEKGRVWLNVGKDGRHFRVLTPEGAVMVFGTTFDVNVVYGSTVVTVKEGEVQVENLNDFTSMTSGDQVRLADDVAQLTPFKVEPETVMAWADRIQADPAAEQIYSKEIKSLGTRVVQAEKVFIINGVDAQQVESISFHWKPDTRVDGHSGYDVYISDDRGEALIKGRLEADLFADKSHSSFEMAVPGNVSLSGVRMLQIKIVPDSSTGSVETAFDVSATRIRSEAGL
ncbi:MAG: FecR domain-containing protein [Candidatus Hydrogenedentes bacterium]|nr:FecR domain-containing protein [Candidatus Hydrogenedentota bacterium]